MTQLPCKEYLHECFAYQEDGTLIWKIRPLAHFNTAHARDVSNFSEGQIAGSLGNMGYLNVRISVKGKRPAFAVQRVIWTMHNGQIPEGYLIDHEDTNRLNNRIGNLRLALPTGNSQNGSLRSDNTSGVKGVCWNNARKRWYVAIAVNSKKHYVGLYKTIEEATLAAHTARSTLHKEFANHGL